MFVRGGLCLSSVEEGTYEGLCEEPIEEIDETRTVHIQIAHLNDSDFLRLQKKLKKQVFKITSQIPCTIHITDDTGIDLREK